MLATHSVMLPNGIPLLVQQTDVNTLIITFEQTLTMIEIHLCHRREFSCSQQVSMVYPSIMAFWQNESRQQRPLEENNVSTGCPTRSAVVLGYDVTKTL